MPQFIEGTDSFIIQIIILGAIYLGIGLINDFLYSFFASHIRSLLGKKSGRWMALIGGIAMILSPYSSCFNENR